MESQSTFLPIREEIWRDIKGWEGLYQVSNQGRIKSLKRYTKSRYGAYTKPVEEKILKHSVNEIDRCLIVLVKPGKRKTMQVHRIVAKAFIPNPENKPQVNHINGISSDNWAINLEWNTAKENTEHAYRIGLRGCGINSQRGAFNQEQIDSIRRLYASGEYSQSFLGEKFGVSQSCIGRICARKTYI